jgi:hypothetical protein
MRSLISTSRHMARWLWHDMEIACRCLWWPCDKNLWPCMKFVSYMLFVLNLIMFRSYAHERENFVKNASLWSWLCHLLVCPFPSCWRCLCSSCGYLACPCLNFSMLQCSSYIWEAHACICRLDSCITNKGKESTQFMFPGVVLHKGMKDWEKCICSGGACIHAFGSSFSCALLPMVSSPFASPWGVGNFEAFYLGCVEPLYLYLP